VVNLIAGWSPYNRVGGCDIVDIISVYVFFTSEMF